MVRTVAAGGHAVEVSGVRPEVGVGSVAYLQAADRDVFHRRLLAARNVEQNLGLGRDELLLARRRRGGVEEVICACTTSLSMLDNSHVRA